MTESAHAMESAKGQILLRRKDSVARLRELLRGKDLLSGVPGAQRYVSRPALAGILQGKEGRRERRNDGIMYRAHVEHG